MLLDELPRRRWARHAIVLLARLEAPRTTYRPRIHKLRQAFDRSHAARNLDVARHRIVCRGRDLRSTPPRASPRRRRQERASLPARPRLTVQDRTEIAGPPP